MDGGNESNENAGQWFPELRQCCYIWTSHSLWCSPEADDGRTHLWQLTVREEGWKGLREGCWCWVGSFARNRMALFAFPFCVCRLSGWIFARSVRLDLFAPFAQKDGYYLANKQDGTQWYYSTHSSMGVFFTLDLKIAIRNEFIPDWTSKVSNWFALWSSWFRCSPPLISGSTYKRNR